MTAIENIVPFLIVATFGIFVISRLRNNSRPYSPPSQSPRSPLAGIDEAIRGWWSEREDVTLLVAAREIRQRVLGRAFRIGTVALLAAVAAAILIPSAIRDNDHTQRVGVVGTLDNADQNAVIAAADSLDVTAIFTTESTSDSAKAEVQAGHLDLAIVGTDTLVILRYGGGDDTSTTARLARAIAEELGVSRAMSAAGLTPHQESQLAAATPLTIDALNKQILTSDERTTTFIGLIVMMVMLTQYLTWTLTGVLEEKANRIVEVLLSTIEPVQLLTGKLLGIGVVVFAQAAVIAGLAFTLANTTGSDVLNGAAPLTLLSMLVWLVLGYALYSWLYAAAGSMGERPDQIQSLTLPLLIPTLLSYVVAFTTLSAGHPSTLAKVLAYVPLTAPFTMPVLVALDAVTWWQFALAVVFDLAVTVGAAWLASTVYRRSIMHTGGRVRFAELLDRAA